MAFSIKDNTVSSFNQVNKSDSVYYLGNETAKKVLILGNSITRHSVLKEIGWENDWGMAASKLENDYVHVLFSLIKENNLDAYFMVRQAYPWENNYNNDKALESLTEEKEFKPDIVIFRMAENIHDVDCKEKQEIYYKSLNSLIDYISTDKTKVIFTNCVWANPLVDEKTYLTSKERNMPFVDLNFIGKDDKYMSFGRFWHGGVAGHPGDLGMKCIAEAIFEPLKKML